MSDEKTTIPSSLALAEAMSHIEAGNIASVLYPARAIDHYKDAIDLLTYQPSKIIDELNKSIAEMRHSICKFESKKSK